jgi:inward rectifier potassium channel
MAGEPKRNVSITNDPRARMPGIIAVGRKLAPHEDLYHWVLALSWTQFFSAVTVAFVLVNAVFALFFAAVPGSVSNTAGFLDCFFFSVQTLGTIGYGTMAPQNAFGHVVVSVEALVGMLMTALVTGLTFVRFARPTARVLFSDKAIIARRDGVPHLMFRLANWRRNQIVEAEISVMILVTERTKEGETMRRPMSLGLVRRQNPMFALTWTVMHAIDESSPFHGGVAALDKLRADRAEIYVSVSGLDETIAQIIHARYRYGIDDIVTNARFVDVLRVKDDGTRILDFDKFHDIQILEEGS